MSRAVPAPVLAAALLFPVPASAGGSAPGAAPEQEQAAPAGAPVALPGDRIAGAEAPPPLREEEISWLKPRASLLPPNPEATTDFTAYTLRGGEVKVGLLSVGLGLLDNVQVSTMPLVYYAGLPNVSAKVDAVHAGPLHLAVTGTRYWLSQDDFRASYTGVGTMASLRVVPAWSLHAGFNYAGIAAKGLPDLCDLSSLITSEACPDDGAGASVGPGSPFGLSGNDVYGEVLWVRMATDLRFNRRDSLILQASAVPFARLQVDDEIQIPDIAGFAEVFAFDGQVPLSTMYMGSVAWQFAWKNAHLRVGVGKSSVPFAWLTQTTELSIRFGGRDRIDRTRQQRAWRRNKKDLEQGLDQPAGVARQ